MSPLVHLFLRGFCIISLTKPAGLLICVSACELQTQKIQPPPEQELLWLSGTMDKRRGRLSLRIGGDGAGEDVGAESKK